MRNGIRWNCQTRGVFGVTGRQDQEIPFIEESLGNEDTEAVLESQSQDPG